MGASGELRAEVEQLRKDVKEQGEAIRELREQLVKPAKPAPPARR